MSLQAAGLVPPLSETPESFEDAMARSNWRRAATPNGPASGPAPGPIRPRARAPGNARAMTGTLHDATSRGPLQNVVVCEPRRLSSASRSPHPTGGTPMQRLLLAVVMLMTGACGAGADTLAESSSALTL